MGVKILISSKGIFYLFPIIIEYFPMDIINVIYRRGPISGSWLSCVFSYHK